MDKYEYTNLFNNPFSFFKSPKYWAKYFFGTFKCIKERIVKGYCWRDVNDLDTYLTAVISNSVEELANNGCTIPWDFYQENDENTTGERDKYKEHLLNISKKISNYISDKNAQNEFYEKWKSLMRSEFKQNGGPTNEQQDLINNYLTRDKELEEEGLKDLESGMRDLIDLWPSLWD